MAFNLSHFQFNRGVITANAQGGGITPVIHTYFTEDDTLAQVSAPGYFPPYIDGDASNDKVFPNDSILVVTQGDEGLFRIFTVNPIVLFDNKLLPFPISNGTVLSSWSGAFTSPQGLTIGYSKIGSMAIIEIDGVANAAASNATTINSLSGVIPVGYRPFSTYTGSIVVTNNSTRTNAVFKIGADGTVTIYATLAEGNFTAAGNAGFISATATYAGF